MNGTPFWAPFAPVIRRRMDKIRQNPAAPDPPSRQPERICRGPRIFRTPFSLRPVGVQRKGTPCIGRLPDRKVDRLAGSTGFCLEPAGCGRGLGNPSAGRYPETRGPVPASAALARRRRRPDPRLGPGGVVQDPDTLIFNAQVWQPAAPYGWRRGALRAIRGSRLLIYEAPHGHGPGGRRDPARTPPLPKPSFPASPQPATTRFSSWLSRSTPYYASFGYHVSSFFCRIVPGSAPPKTSKGWWIRPTAMAFRWLRTWCIPHAAANTVEGLSRFDGTDSQYFHAGDRGLHSAWGSRCFDYGKDAVLHFLLSNCRFWLDEYPLRRLPLRRGHQHSLPAPRPGTGLYRLRRIF